MKSMNINHFVHKSLIIRLKIVCFPTDGVTHKADLDAFIKRCKRKFSNEIEYLWKLEFQKRGAPHYHMIIHLPKPFKIDYLRKWFSKNGMK